MLLKNLLITKFFINVTEVNYDMLKSSWPNQEGTELWYKKYTTISAGLVYDKT